VSQNLNSYVPAGLEWTMALGMIKERAAREAQQLVEKAERERAEDVARARMAADAEAGSKRNESASRQRPGPKSAVDSERRKKEEEDYAATDQARLAKAAEEEE